MSMDRCSKCSDLVDTDIDCEFYDFTYKSKTRYDGHCINCRDDIMDGMTDAEQDAHENRIYGVAS